MHSYHFCPFCGTKYQSVQPEKWARHCHSCQKTFYQNQATTSCGVIVEQRKMLFVVRSRDPGEGMLDLPGGFAEPDEEIQASLIRELQEELSVRTMVIKFLGLYDPVPYEFQGSMGYNCDHFYLVELLEHDLKPADDVAKIQWRSLDDLPQPAEMAFESQQWFLEQVRNKKISFLS